MSSLPAASSGGGTSGGFFGWLSGLFSWVAKDRVVQRNVIAGFLALTAAALVRRALIRRRAHARLRNSVVVVTGASSGIGACVARQLASPAFGVQRVILMARSEGPLRELAAEINGSDGGERALAVPCDGGDGAAMAAAFGQILSRYGRVDALVNCAGAGAFKELWAQPAADIVRSLDAPFLAAAFASRAALPSMLARGEGSVVMVQSPASRAPFPGTTSYSASRWALRGLAAALRADTHGTGVAVSEAICGETDSNYFDANGGRERLPGIAAIFPRLTPAAAAEHVCEVLLESAGGRSVTSTSPELLSWTMWMHGLAPDLVQGLINLTGWRAPPATMPRVLDDDVAAKLLVAAACSSPMRPASPRLPKEGELLPI